MSAVDVVIVLGDVHLPFHDADALQLALKVISATQPRYVVQVGDMLDGYHLSRFDHDPNKKNVTLKEEARYGRALIRKVSDLCDQAVWMEGNHEERLRRKLAQVPELHSTHPTMAELLGLEPHEYVPYRKEHVIGKCHFVHDLGPAGINAIRQTVEAAGHNVVFGHTHQGGTLYDGNLAGDRHVGLNVGWLGNPDHADYATPRARARWQHGVGYVEIDRVTGECWCHFLPFVNGKCRVPGVSKAVTL